MTYDIHQTPGRIRVRTARVRRSPAAAAAAVRLLARVEGVRDVRCSSQTGSLTVTYHETRLSPGTIIDVLAAHGYLGAGVVGFPAAPRGVRHGARRASAATTGAASDAARLALKGAALLVLPLLARRALRR